MAVARSSQRRPYAQGSSNDLQLTATGEQIRSWSAAAKDLDAKRAAWLNPPDCPEPELKKRTLTNLYNRPPTWLEMAHHRLDRAVWFAYNWPDDPTETTEDELLTRLLSLNQQRTQ